MKVRAKRTHKLISKVLMAASWMFSINRKSCAIIGIFLDNSICQLSDASKGISIVMTSLVTYRYLEHGPSQVQISPTIRWNFVKVKAKRLHILGCHVYHFIILKAIEICQDRWMSQCFYSLETRLRQLTLSLGSTFYLVRENWHLLIRSFSLALLQAPNALLFEA